MTRYFRKHLAQFITTPAPCVDPPSVPVNPPCCANCQNRQYVLPMHPTVAMVPGTYHCCVACFRMYSPGPAELSDAPHPLFPTIHTVGFEVECVVTSLDPHILAWAQAKGDGSIRVGARGGLGREFTSRPALGTGLNDVLTGMATSLNRMEAYTNASCGLHVHHCVTPYSQEQRRNIRMWWRLFEPLFAACVHPWRRNNAFARDVGVLNETNWAGSRYSSLNIAAVGQHNTYEIRLPEGSVDPEYIAFWLSLTSHFFKNLALAPPDATLLEFLRQPTCTDRDILSKFINLCALPGPTTRRLVDAIKTFGLDAWDLKKVRPRLATVAPPEPIEDIHV